MLIQGTNKKFEANDKKLDVLVAKVDELVAKVASNYLNQYYSTIG
jgi:hypothetical protein